MKCWKNKVAVVTDCNDEVGISVIEQLAIAGMTAIGFAKNMDKLSKASKKLNHFKNIKTVGKIVICKCDITNLKLLRTVFEKIFEIYGGVDVLVNNAYCNIDCLVSTGKFEEFRRIIDVNINSLVACIKLAAGSMIGRKSRGHIININDIFAYQIPEKCMKSVFIASKVAITSVNEILRHEFRYLKANIKVTNIACGVIESESESAHDEPRLRIRDVAKLVKLILNTPEHLQVHEVLLDSCYV